MKHNLLIITGPTASGKTGLAARLAYKLNSEIISADSRQVYRGLDIGTGKDLNEYVIKGKPVPYHLIDVAEPGEFYDLFRFYKSFFELFKKFQSKGIIPILAGGTPLYIHSVIKNYKLLEVPENKDLRKKLETWSDKNLIEHLTSIEPDHHNTTDFEERERLLRAIEIALYKKENPHERSPGEGLEIKPFIIGTGWDRNILKERIKKRLLERFKSGMVEEVERLHREGCSWEKLNYFGLEYKYIALYLQNKMSYKEMADTLYIKICQFSKRQMTWFRKIEKEGFKINWIEGSSFEKACEVLKTEGFKFI